MSRTLKLVSLLTLAALLLAACGASAPATQSAPAPEAATQAPAAEAPTAAPAEATTAPESAPAAAESSAEVSFANDVLPILESRCLNCHGGQRTSEGLSLKTYDSLMAGSQNGAVVTPGDAANSLFISLSAEGKMPKRGPKLTPAEIELLTNWVNAGAQNN